MKIYMACRVTLGGHKSTGRRELTEKRLLQQAVNDDSRQLAEMDDGTADCCQHG